MTITTLNHVTRHRPSILDPSFKWVSSAHTDVRETWLRHGWQPPDRRHQHRMRVKLNWHHSNVQPD